MAKMNVWMSVSDLMTGLMVIFLFVSIAYMHQAHKLIEEQKQQFTEYVDTRQKLYEELHEEFKEQVGNNILAINNDLSIRFAEAETLFEEGKYDVSEHFESTLEDIIPLYMNLLLHDSLRNYIKEVRIEGHTDTLPFKRLGSDPYLSNLELSQKRAYEVVKCIRKICANSNFDQLEREQIEDWLTAVGYSYTNALDGDGNFASKSGKPIDNDLSKRVEIRIITDDYRVIKTIVKD